MVELGRTPSQFEEDRINRLADLTIAMGWRLKTFLCIPLTHGFLMGAVHFLSRGRD